MKRTAKISAIFVGGLVALATMTPGQAAWAGSRLQHNNAAPLAYNAQGNPTYGFGPLQRVHPHDVVSGGRIIGRDPDPFIRGEILRHYHSGWPD